MSETANAGDNRPAVPAAVAEIDRRLEAAAARVAVENEQLSSRTAILRQQNIDLRKLLEHRRAFAARLEQIATDLRRK